VDDSSFKNKRKNVIGFSILLWYLFWFEHPLGDLTILGVDLRLNYRWSMGSLWLLFYYFSYRLIIHARDKVLNDMKIDYLTYTWGYLKHNGLEVLKSKLESNLNISDERSLLNGLESHFTHKHLRFNKPVNYRIHIDMNVRSGTTSQNPRNKQHTFKINNKISWIVFKRRIRYFFLQRNSSEFLIPTLFGGSTFILGFIVLGRWLYTFYFK